jgi:hypothetical protein
MLIVPSGHWQEASSGPRRITRRERWILGGVLAMVAVLVVIVAISFTSKQRTSANGCIDVSAATVIGGSELYRCGTAARDLCSAPNGTGQTAKPQIGRFPAPAPEAPSGAFSLHMATGYPYVQGFMAIAGLRYMARNRGAQQPVISRLGPPGSACTPIAGAR